MKSYTYSYIVAQLNRRGVIDFTLADMIETTEHLMTCGFNVTYAHTGLRTILLLFDINENSYDRKANLLVSILAAEASAKLTQLSGQIATFDSRILEFPNKDLVAEYFQSRKTDSNNSSWSYWKGSKTSIRELATVKSGKMIEGINDVTPLY